MKIELYPRIILNEEETAAFDKVIDILEEAKKGFQEDTSVAPEIYHRVSDLIDNFYNFYWETY